MERQLRRETVQETIIAELRRYISDHRVKAGDRLPPLSVMAAGMSVSQAALREALHRLDALGALNIVNGRGVFLVNPELVRMAGERDPREDPALLADLVELRWLLETEAVRQIIKRATDEQIEGVGLLLKKLMDRYEAGQSDHKEDKAFHMGLYGITNNQALLQVLSVVLRTFSIMWQYPLGMERPFYDTAIRHEALYNAIKSRDESLAVEICRATCDDMLASIQAVTEPESAGHVQISYPHTN